MSVPTKKAYSLRTNRFGAASKSSSQPTAFTLVELLVVIAIIGVLVALLLPAVQSAREAARRTDCKNRMRQLGIAVQNYHDTKKELPPSRIGDWYATWLYLVLPYIEQANISNIWDEKNGFVADAPAEFRELTVPTFLCPSQDHDSLIVTDNDGVTGSISDYQVFVSSTLPIAVTLARSSGNPPTVVVSNGIGWDNSTMHGADGAIIQPHRYEDIQRGPGNSILSWRSRTALRNITDGTTNTYMIGEVAKWETEGDQYAKDNGINDAQHTFDGNYNRGQSCGLTARFTSDNERSPRDRGLDRGTEGWECAVGWPSSRHRQYCNG